MPFLPALGTIIPYLTLAGAGMAVAGQYQAGKAAEEQGKRTQEWREYNAELAEREASEALASASEEERKFRKGATRLKATQRARYAKAGVTFAGTPERFFEEQKAEIEEDALEIRRGGQIGARRLTAEAGLERLAGKSALLRGKASRRASRYGMASTAFSGAASAGYQYGSLTGRWP